MSFRPRSTRDLSRRVEHPLSFEQERLWFLEQLHPGTPTNNVPVALRLSGRLNRVSLRRAFHAVVARHESLRTTFTSVGGRPVQIVGNGDAFELSEFDISGNAKEELGEDGWQMIRQETHRPFFVRRDSMVRAALLRLAADEHILLLTLHHIASDGWSRGILFRELAEIYTAYSAGKAPALPELPTRYTDHVYWQRERLQGERLERHLSYWRQRLRELPVLALPTDGPLSASPLEGVSVTQIVSRDLSEALTSLSKQEESTLFMTLLTAFQILLQRHVGQDDIAVGYPIAGRTRPEIKPLIGIFVNTLVARIDLSSNPSFRELLRVARRSLIRDYLHQEVPFAKLVQELHPERDLRRNPLFDVMVNFHDPSWDRLELPGLEILSNVVDGRGQAAFS